eukprot:jgi/Botrbrau1/13840/Bobra.0056s0077.1
MSAVQNVKVVVSDDSTDFENNLSVQDSEVPRPGENEVLVRVLLRPVNPSDVGMLSGIRKEGSTPFTPGLEGMGIVAELGPGVVEFSQGQRVVGLPWPTRSSGQGTWQQYVVNSKTALIPVPDGISDEAAAMFVVNPLTAFGLLEDLRAPTGSHVIQTAAGSVLGRMFNQLAKRQGVHVINVIRRAAQKDELASLGMDIIIATDEEDLEERVKEITGGQGAHSAIECVAGDMTAKVMRCVREGGTTFLYGGLSGRTATVDVVDVIYGARKLDGWVLGSWVKRQGASLPNKLSLVFDLIQQNAITFNVGTRYPLEDVVAAVRESIAVARGGKVLLEG